MSEDDPNSAYTIEPNTADTMLRDWWIVRMNGERLFLLPKDGAERFVTDPEYRKEMRAKWPNRLPN